MIVHIVVSNYLSTKATFKGNNDDDVLVIDNSQVSINRLLITQNINSNNLITRLIENDNTTFDIRTFEIILLIFNQARILI